MTRFTPYRRAQLWPKIAHVHSVDEVEGMQFRVENKTPPNFETIKLVFPAVETMKVLYTHDHVIYNPSAIPSIDLALIAHECTHILQQDAIGTGQWWDFYLESAKFRFEQELDAYRVEYRAYCREKSHNRADKKRYCRSCAERLSGPLYNRCVRRRDAQELIRLIDHEEKTHVRDGANDGRAPAIASIQLTPESIATAPASA